MQAKVKTVHAPKPRLHVRVRVVNATQVVERPPERLRVKR